MKASELKELFELQKECDQKIFEAHKIDYQSILKRNGFYYAALDELGEWNHEKKGEWCWWKFTQPEVDRPKTLEEYIDLVHFVLSFCLALNDGEVPEVSSIIGTQSFTVPVCINTLLTFMNMEVQAAKRVTSFDIPRVIRVLLSIGLQSGFGDWEIFDEYVKKNKKNKDRVDQKY